ncbi:MAG: helix-turn-helix domain-containing protein [Magnetococcales bacterium]|nr:helix-turn-helix domain-containing protein [Magnetococcales bacterium]
MAQASNLTPEQRTEIVLALLRREEPASILARRYGVSTKTISQWKDDFIAAGTSGLAAGKRQSSDNAKQLAALESAVVERDRVIGELTIANVILKKNGAVLPSTTVFARS